MDSILDMLNQQLGGSAISQISQQIGADETTTQNAITAAVPMLMAALAKNASEPEGANALHQALAADHDGSILDNVSGYLSNPDQANGNGILGHAFGGQQDNVMQGLSGLTGMNIGSLMKLLPLLAPLVMGMLGRKQQQGNLSPSDLSNVLNGQTQATEAASPGLMGMLTGLLDSNKDGSMMDDLSRIAGSIFKR